LRTDTANGLLSPPRARPANKVRPYEFKKFSFYQKPQSGLLFSQSGGTEKVWQSRFTQVNEEPLFHLGIEKTQRLKRNTSNFKLTARQENIIGCAKGNNTTYLMKFRDQTTVADLNMRDNKGNTALYYAVSNCYYDVAKMLIQMGADVNKQNSLGNTALHKAFMTENLLMVHLLLSNGASLTVMNEAMQAPTYFARTKTINELGLSRFPTHFLTIDNFKTAFKEDPKIRKELRL